MDLPPPVPPKDPPFLRRMAVEDPHPRPTSGSKRKRGLTDEITDAGYASAPCRGDNEYASPSKDRSSAASNNIDASADEATPAVPRSVKRKKKVGNLSHLNLRHAAHEQEVQQEQQHHLFSRESKFQEGSLGDKPIQKPPSAFTRLPRSDSDQLSHHVDTLMTDYHEGLSTPDPSRLSTTDVSTRSTVASLKKEETGGLFQFGRNFAGNFHPVNLWNKLWNQSREELTRQNEEESVRKTKLKSEAEAKYEEMKRSGMFGLQGGVPTPSEEHDPRDSAVMLDSGRESAEEELYVDSGLLPAVRDGRDTPSEQQDGDGTLKPRKGLKSRLTMKRPSLANLKNVLRPAKSEYHLRETADRASSHSASPIKPEFGTPATRNDGPTVRGLGIDSSTVRRSSSKYDLKRQHKLSKRVSDLESKLQQARQELDAALVEASPMPTLNHKYERFNPGTFDTVKRFQPRLPRLDSERILMGEVAHEEENELRKTMGMTDRTEDKTIRQRHFGIRMPSLSRRTSFEPSTYIEASSERDNETIKSSRSKSSYLPLASLFPHNPTSLNNRENIAVMDSNDTKSRETGPTEASGVDVQDMARTIKVEEPQCTTALTNGHGTDTQDLVMADTIEATTSPANGSIIREEISSTETTHGQAVEDASLKSVDSEVNSIADDSPAKSTDEATSETNGSLTALNAKLKAINNQHRLVQKSKKPAKRKSRGEKGGKTYKPGKNDEDDAEWEVVEKETPRKKKHKSGGSIRSARSQRTKKFEVEDTSSRTSPAASVNDNEENGTIDRVSETARVTETAQEADATAFAEKRKSASKRMSIDSAALEPVYEEEEEMSTVPLSGDPVKPTATATPARFASQIPRSASPIKGISTPVGAEEDIMTRAALAAQHQRNAQTPGGTPATFVWPDDVF